MEQIDVSSGKCPRCSKNFLTAVNLYYGPFKNLSGKAYCERCAFVIDINSEDDLIRLFKKEIKMKHEASFWIVMAADMPTTISTCHSTQSSAEDEAKRLAKRTGKKFFVMESVYAVEVDNFVETRFEDIPF
jgi:hypothetical protein